MKFTGLGQKPLNFALTVKEHTPYPIMQSKRFDLNWLGPGIFRLSKTPIKYKTNNMDMNIPVGRDVFD